VWCDTVRRAELAMKDLSKRRLRREGLRGILRGSSLGAVGLVGLVLGALLQNGRRTHSLQVAFADAARLYNTYWVRFERG
jgi:hypothetical protein